MTAFPPSQTIEILESRIAPAVFTVTTLKDITNATNTTGSLRDAITLADASTDTTNTINFAVRGTINLVSSLPQISMIAGSNLGIDGQVDIKLPGVIINAHGHQVFSIVTGGVALFDMTIKNAKAGLNFASNAVGGAIYINDNDSVTMQTMTVKNNVATGSGSYTGGGGIYVSPISTLTITKCSITGNVSTALGGGKSYGGGIACRGTLSIQNSVITGNIAKCASNTDGNSGGAAYGGGIGIVGSVGTVTIADTLISGNKALGGNGDAGAKGMGGGSGGNGAGGGVYNGGAEMFISSSILSNNQARGGSGGAAGSGKGTQRGSGGSSIAGGVSTRGPSASLTIARSIISGNHAIAGGGSSKGTAWGGGVYSGPYLNVSQTTISNNSAVNGGGMYVYGSPSPTNAIISGVTISGNKAATGAGLQFGFFATATVENCTIANNSAQTAGAGIEDQGGTLSIYNDTVAGNSVSSSKGEGGGLDVNNFLDTVNIVSTIIANNHAHNGADLFSGDSSFVTASYDLIRSTPISGSITDNGNNLYNENPHLGLLAYNGGLTRTMLPAADSPVINMGSNPNNLTTDQRGDPRVSGGGIDIGAVQR
ncbi:MAG: choice-of-anchor Q domain-containing protein [Chthoniobacteraceae bacterium]|jgi:hypothetical protein